MKKIILLLFLVAGIQSFGQQIYIEAGKIMSSFDFKNSQGNRLDNLQASSHGFMAIGYRNQVLAKNLNILLGTSYASYGAIGSDDAVGNYMKWDLNYLEFNVGLDYELFKIRKAIFYIKGTASAEFLVQGVQTLNNRVIDLKNTDNFDKTIYDFRGGFGFLHSISENLSFYAQYMYGKSISLKNGVANTADKEKLRIVSNTIGFGLLINIVKKSETIKEQID